MHKLVLFNNASIKQCVSLQLPMLVKFHLDLKQADVYSCVFHKTKEIWAFDVNYRNEMNAEWNHFLTH